MKKLYAMAAVGLSSLCFTAMNTQSASANNITFAVIAPHEYELPVNYDDFSVFVQYNQINSSGKFYNDDGKLTNIPGKQNLYVGLSKYVYFTTFDAMPNVGWAFEAIVPEVYIGRAGAPNLSGVGDPIFGFATWIKPTANSTLGVQSFLQPPIGSREVTNNYWNNLSSVLFDVQFEKISFVGDVGVVIPFSEEESKIGRFRPGESFHTNLRWGYKFDDKSIPLEPFLALDYQSDQADKFAGRRIAQSSGHDLSLGAGLLWKIDDQYSIAVHYSRSVDGKNVVPTNAVYFRLAIAPLFKTSKATAPIVTKY